MDSSNEPVEVILLEKGRATLAPFTIDDAFLNKTLESINACEPCAPLLNVFSEFTGVSLVAEIVCNSAKVVDGKLSVHMLFVDGMKDKIHPYIRTNEYGIFLGVFPGI